MLLDKHVKVNITGGKSSKVVDAAAGPTASMNVTASPAQDLSDSLPAVPDIAPATLSANWFASVTLVSTTDKCPWLTCMGKHNIFLPLALGMNAVLAVAQDMASVLPAAQNLVTVMLVCGSVCLCTCRSHSL